MAMASRLRSISVTSCAKVAHNDGNQVAHDRGNRLALHQGNRVALNGGNSAPHLIAVGKHKKVVSVLTNSMSFLQHARSINDLNTAQDNVIGADVDDGIKK